MSFVVVLSSESELKTSAVRKALTAYAEKQGKILVIVNISTRDAPIPEQPIETGEKCAKLRNKYMKKEIKNKNMEYDMLVSIENSIQRDHWHDDFRDNDWCDIIIEDKSGNMYSGREMKIVQPLPYVDRCYYDLAKERTPEDYEYLEDGFSVTIGSLIHEKYPDIPANNWMNDKRFGKKSKGIDRKEIIIEIITGMLEEIEITRKKINKLKDAIITVTDFPKPGVLFQDLSDVLINPKLLKIMPKLLKKLLNTNLIDYRFHYLSDDYDNVVIMGLDARGFLYGMMMAKKLKCGFIMARKAGKLPGKTIKQEYGTEYSKACIEVMPHLINKDTKVIVVDDLVATGGSLKAAVDLTEKCGGKVIACVTILQVDSLVEQAKEKLGDIPLAVLIK